MNDVEGKWAFVTGASRGIGREIALFLAEQGINVVVHSRKLAHTESLVDEIRKFGVEGFAVSAELSESDSVMKMADDVFLRISHLDFLFNNAGVQPKVRRPYYEMNVEEYLWAYKVNVVAPMLFVKKFLPGMLERGFGRIINTTSGVAKQPEQGAYAASKGALDKLTKDLAFKLSGTGVTINVADPGWIQTDLGGPNATNTLDTVIPGMVVGAFVPDTINGKWISAQIFKGMTLDETLTRLEESVKEIQR